LGIGDLDKALFFLNQARQLVQDTPDDDLLSGILFDLGEVYRFQGNFEQSAALYDKALVLPRWEEEKSTGYGYFANLERLRFQIEEAKQHFIYALQFIKTDSDWNFFAPFVILFIAYFAVDQQMTIQATSLFGWIESQNKIKGRVQQPIYKAEFDRYLDQAREGLSESEFSAAWAEGQSMSQEQILALAMEVLQ
jgi:tetratricopeptide (TPR) repeat protein